MYFKYEHVNLSNDETKIVAQNQYHKNSVLESGNFQIKKRRRKSIRLTINLRRGKLTTKILLSRKKNKSTWYTCNNGTLCMQWPVIYEIGHLFCKSSECISRVPSSANSYKKTVVILFPERQKQALLFKCKQLGRARGWNLVQQCLPSGGGWWLICVHAAAADDRERARGEEWKNALPNMLVVCGERERLVCPLECVDPPRCLRLLPGRAALGRFINHVVAKTLKHGSQRAHTHTHKHTYNNVAIFQRRPCTSRCRLEKLEVAKLFCFVWETHPGYLVETLQFYLTQIDANHWEKY